MRGNAPEIAARLHQRSAEFRGMATSGFTVGDERWIERAKLIADVLHEVAEQIAPSTQESSAPEQAPTAEQALERPSREHERRVPELGRERRVPEPDEIERLRGANANLQRVCEEYEQRLMLAEPVYQVARKAYGAIHDVHMCFSSPMTWIADAEQSNRVTLTVRQYHALDALVKALVFAQGKESE